MASWGQSGELVCLRRADAAAAGVQVQHVGPPLEARGQLVGVWFGFSYRMPWAAWIVVITKNTTEATTTMVIIAAMALPGLLSGRRVDVCVVT